MLKEQKGRCPTNNKKSGNFFQNLLQKFKEKLLIKKIGKNKGLKQFILGPVERPTPRASQLWTFFRPDKDLSEPGVICCVVDIYPDGAAYVVPLHNQPDYKTGVEPKLNHDDLPFPGRLFAVVELGLYIAPEAFEIAEYIGDVSLSGLQKINDGLAEFKNIVADSSRLSYLEAHAPEEIDDDLLNAGIARVLFLPREGDIEGLEKLHIQLQSIIQSYHELAILRTLE